MDSSTSRIYTSPSFTTHSHSSNDIADIADRVVQELRIQNGFGNDDVFTFSDDDNPPDIRADDNLNNNNRTETVKRNEEDEFEFPVSISISISTDDVITDDQISLQYPLFDRSLLSDTDLNFSNGVNSPLTESQPLTVTRPSLRKLFSEDRDSPSTSSSSETEDLDGIAPGTYCVWKPKTETETDQQPPRGKHKKSNSVSIDNISKRWKVRDLLKRSYSDDNYCTGKESPVVVFIPPISPDLKTNNEKVNSNGKVGKGGSVKAEKNIPAYKAKIGNIRIPPYYPYRQDQVAAFANFNGSNTNLYRY